MSITQFLRFLDEAAGSGTGKVTRTRLFDPPFPLADSDSDKDEAEEQGSDREELERLPESPTPGPSGTQQPLSEMEQAFADSQGQMKKKLYKPSVLEQVKA